MIGRRHFLTRAAQLLGVGAAAQMITPEPVVAEGIPGQTLPFASKCVLPRCDQTRMGAYFCHAHSQPLGYIYTGEVRAGESFAALHVDYVTLNGVKMDAAIIAFNDMEDWVEVYSAADGTPIHGHDSIHRAADGDIIRVARFFGQVRGFFTTPKKVRFVGDSITGSTPVPSQHLSVHTSVPLPAYNESVLAYQEETTWGVQPASGRKIKFARQIESTRDHVKSGFRAWAQQLEDMSHA